jgi:hypothetical protein
MLTAANIILFRTQPNSCRAICKLLLFLPLLLVATRLHWALMRSFKLQAVQRYLQVNDHSSVDTAILLSQVGSKPGIQEVILGDNVKLSQIFFSIPDLFGIHERGNKSISKLAVYLVLNAISNQLHSNPIMKT